MGAGFEFCLSHFESEFCGVMANKRLKKLEIRAEVKPLRNTESQLEWDKENVSTAVRCRVALGEETGMPSGETQEEGGSLLRTRNVANPGIMSVF